MNDQQRIFGQNKIFEHLDKLQIWKDGGNDTLITFEIHPTNACNNKCPHCSGWSETDKKGSMSREELLDWLGQARSIGARGAIFSGGGEPFLNPHTVEGVVRAHSLGMDVGIITNGLAFPRTPQELNSLLSNSTWIRFSVDAGTPDLYMKTHGMNSSSFEKVWQNIHALVQYRNGGNFKCDIGTAYLTGKLIPETLNLEEMRAFVKSSIEAGVDYCQFRPFLGDLTQIAEQMEALKKEFPRGITIAPSAQKYRRMGDPDPRPYDKCLGVNFTTAIAADGSVFVCCHQVGKTRYCLGNLKKEKLTTIWSRRQEIFDRIQFSDCPLFCRADEFNRVLWEMQKTKKHTSFL